MVHPYIILVQLNDTLVQLPAFHSLGKSHFKDPNSGARIFGHIFLFCVFHYGTLKRPKKRVRTLDSSERLKVVQYPDFTLLEGLW